MQSVGTSAALRTWVPAAEVKATYIDESRKSKSPTEKKQGRRGLLLFALGAATTQPNDSRTQLLKKYLEKSEENKEKNDKERLESYYRRNYKDYFELLEGGLKQKKKEELSESEKGILEWLENNK